MGNQVIISFEFSRVRDIVLSISSKSLQAPDRPIPLLPPWILIVPSPLDPAAIQHLSRPRI